jgi:SIR2-like domain
LAEYLAAKYEYPAKQNCMECGREGFQPDLDLARVSQYGVMQLDEGPLKEELRRVFRPQYQPTSLHRFLAGLPSPNPDRTEDQYPLFVTTNYDDLIEQALGEDNFDLVFYNPADNPPRFWHKEPGKAAARIDGDANQYPFHFFEKRPVVLKIHGTIDRASQDLDGFVITEDDYIQYLAEEPLENFLPSALLGKMRQMHHLLFLGYGLRDWNLRVFLRRLARDPDERYRAWAVYLSDDETERQFWGTKGIQILNVDLKIFMYELQRQLVSRTGALAAVQG